MPGVSRSGITITTGRFSRLNRDASARFSFLLLIPIVLGAVIYKGLKHVVLEPLPAGSTGPFIVGTIAAAGVGLIAIDVLLGYLRKHDYTPFVIYRLVLAVAIAAIILSGWRGAASSGFSPNRNPRSHGSAMLERPVATTRLHPDAPIEALLNRELSWLDLNGRVLELAADPNEPLLERVKFCSIFSSNLDEFFMVRVAGLLDQVVSGVSVRSRDGRTSQQTLDEIRARVLELSAQQAQLWRDQLCPALAAEHDPGRHRRRRHRRRAGRARAHLRAADLSRPDAAGGRPGPAVPVHLRPLAQPRRRRARPRVGRGALRAGQGARGPPALPLGRRPWPADPARVGDLALPAVALPRDGGGRAASRSASPATATPRSRTTPTTCWRPSRASCASADSAPSSASRSRAPSRRRCSRGSRNGSACIPPTSIRSRGSSTSPTWVSSTGSTGPDLKYEPWLPYTQRRLQTPSDGDLFAEIAQRDIVVQHPVRLVRHERRVVRPRGREGPARRDAEDDRLSHEPRLRARARADARGARTASRACASSS